MTEHRQGAHGGQYFAPAPDSEDIRRRLNVDLRGHHTQVETSNGVFSAHRLDLGTSVLLKHAPEPPHRGSFLDLGCGWGPLSLALALERPEATIWALDVNERALELTRRNARTIGLPNVRAVTAQDVPEKLGFDLIWSNPPIRVGKDELHRLLMAWLPRLNHNGRAYLVVQKNLGADSLTPWLQTALGPAFIVGKHSSSKGYRVIEIARTTPVPARQNGDDAREGTPQDPSRTEDGDA